MAAVATTSRKRSLPALRAVPVQAGQGRRQRIDEARVLELHARRELAGAIAQMERTYAQALRSLETFEAYLSTVRKNLRRVLDRPS
jgi:hypothetical protein